MMVKLTASGWDIIHQPAHALLAFQLGQYWKADSRPLHWPETLIALTEHDDGQEPYEDRNHLSELGAPMHFQKQGYSVEQARNMISIALEKSRWNALMVSMHGTFLYEEERGDDPEMNEFLDQQKKNQQSWRRQYGVSKAEAAYAYDFVQWCDAFSLILCRGQVPPKVRRVEISKGPDGEPYYVFQRPDGSLGVDPWPYEMTDFLARIEYCSLGQLVFKNDNELYNAMQEAPVQAHEWRLRC